MNDGLQAGDVCIRAISTSSNLQSFLWVSLRLITSLNSVGDVAAPFSKILGAGSRLHDAAQRKEPETTPHEHSAFST